MLCFKLDEFLIIGGEGSDDVCIVTCHVLILTPFIVLCITISLTVMFETQALVLSLPKLPMLIPCPGPQFTLRMYTFEHPVCMETQSSPAPINRFLRAKVSINTKIDVFMY